MRNMIKFFAGAAGVAALAAAGFLILRGALPLAIPLAVFGLSLIRRSSGFGFGVPFGSARRGPGHPEHARRIQPLTLRPARPHHRTRRQEASPR